MNVAESTKADDAGKRRSLRPRAEVNYNLDEPSADEFVYCDQCKEECHNGCEIHTIFDYDHNFEVGPSKLPGAGRGIFNNDLRDVPEGVMFGPYAGTFYTPQQYRALKKSQGESGYAWQVRDADKVKVLIP